ncbi:MAG: InlB B-repeat-containing protein [Turneriella sp.]
MIRKTHLSLIFLSLLAVACPGETGGSGSAGGGTVPAPGSAGSGSFVVIFDGQSAMNDPNPNFKVVNSPAITVDALPTPPTKPHVTFGGWFTAKNGGGTQFTASSNVSGNMTVYAKWDPVLTVKIGNLLWKKCAEGQANDGSCTGMPKYYQYCTDGVPSNCFNGTTLFAGPIYDACNALNSNPSGGYAGKTTWRVPTAAESIATRYCSAGFDAVGQRCNVGSVAPTLDPNLFPNTLPAARFWTINLESWWVVKYDTAIGVLGSSANDSGVGTIDPQPLDPSGLPNGWHYLRCVADDP